LAVGLGLAGGLYRAGTGLRGRFALDRAGGTLQGHRGSQLPGRIIRPDGLG
jgi:hypothetical protein